MKKYLLKEKRLTCLIISFWVAVLIAATGNAPALSAALVEPGPVEMLSNETVSGIGVIIAQSSGDSQAESAETDVQTEPDGTGDSGKSGFRYQQALERVMDLVFVYLDSLEKQKDIGTVEKKQKAVEFIRNVRWGPKNKYYFWINNLDGIMVLEPLYPRTEGTSVIKYKDLNNREIFVEFISNSLKDGQTFVNHNGLGYDVNSSPKVSLVRLFGAWDWIVGTYVELDDIEAYESPGELQLFIPVTPIEDQAPASAS
ncbi:MAG: cache domain-containing protein [Pseudomonadota bacterium]